MKLPELGDVLMAKYRLDSVLGEGGFGIVYAGETVGTGRKVAMKVLKPGEDGYGTEASRFMREMKTIAQLQSANTVTLYDYGRTDDGVLFMVCEHVDGEDLSTLLARRTRLEEAEVVHLARQILESLAEAHGVGLLHRDIKPANIRIFEYGGDPLRVKVLDFGLARPFEGDVARITATGRVIGTPRYMAPERMTGEATSPSSDLFSLGVVLFEALRGRNVTAGVPMWASETLLEPGDVSDGLRAIVNRLLARDVSARYRMANEVLDDLRRLHKPVERPEPAPVRSSRSAPAEQVAVQRSAAPRLLGALVALLGMGGVVFAMWPEPATPVREVTRQVPTLIHGSNTAPVHNDEPTEVADPGPCPGYEPLEPGVQQVSMMRGLEPLSVWVRIPPGYAPNRKYRTILMLHEGTNNPQLDLAQVEGPHIREHDVIVAPADLRLNKSWLGRNVAQNIRRDLDVAADRVCLDTDRLFALGIGRGGMGVDSLRCEEPRLVAAATTAHRVQKELPCHEAHPAMLQFHMTKDPVAPFDGNGCVNPLLSLDAHMDVMEEDYGCGGGRRRLPSQPGAECWTRDCDAVYRWCVVEGGRWWRGTTRDQRLGKVFDTCHSEASGYAFGEVIWDFFDEMSAATAKPNEEENEQGGE